MKKIRVAVIGVGNMGQHHARIYSSLPGVKLIGVCDTDGKRAESIALKYNCLFETDYQNFLRKEKIDAVSIVVPTSLHCQIACKVLDMGIHVLLEKPIASSVVEAKKIIDLAEKNKKILMVGHIERFNPAVVKLKQLITEGKIGKVINLLAVRVGILFPGIKNSDVLIDLGIHDIDIFNYLLGEYPSKKKIVKHRLVKGNLADSVVVLLEYSKATCVIQTNWITPIKIRKLYVTGTNGYVELDYIKQKIIFYEKKKSKIIDDNFSNFLSLSKLPSREVYISKKEPLREELLYFLKAIENSTKIDSHYALEALKIVVK